MTRGRPGAAGASGGGGFGAGAAGVPLDLLERFEVGTSNEPVLPGLDAGNATRLDETVQRDVRDFQLARRGRQGQEIVITRHGRQHSTHGTIIPLMNLAQSMAGGYNSPNDDVLIIMSERTEEALPMPHCAPQSSGTESNHTDKEGLE